MGSNGLKVNDRVKRKRESRCLGIVRELREEVTSSAKDPKDRPILIKVQWDNGTFSYLDPEALEAATS